MCKAWGTVPWNSVLIVAKCIVNSQGTICKKIKVTVLIVAKCIVNTFLATSLGSELLY